MNCKPVVKVLRVPEFADRAKRLCLCTSIAKAFIAMKIGIERVEDMVIIPPQPQENYGNTDDIIIEIDLAQIRADSRTVMEKILSAVKQVIPSAFVQIKLCEGNARYLAF